MGCQPTPTHLTQSILREQWERVSRKIPHSKNNDPKNCIDIYVPVAKDINSLMESIISSNSCERIGCIHVPITIINNSFIQSDVFCDPIVFYNIKESNETLQNVLATSILAPLIPEGSIVKGSRKQIYLMKNGVLHGFPNADVFLSLGYNFNNVITISDEKLKKFVIGDFLTNSV